MSCKIKRLVDQNTIFFLKVYSNMCSFQYLHLIHMSAVRHASLKKSAMCWLHQLRGNCFHPLHRSFAPYPRCCLSRIATSSLRSFPLGRVHPPFNISGK